jgi:hypothetical protein
MILKRLNTNIYERTESCMRSVGNDCEVNFPKGIVIRGQAEQRYASREIRKNVCTKIKQWRPSPIDYDHHDICGINAEDNMGKEDMFVSFRKRKNGKNRITRALHQKNLD